MKAIVQRAYGEPAEVLRLEELDRPAVKDGEVLVRIRAAGVNWADSALTRGIPLMLRLTYGLSRPRSPVRGTDVAGTVATVGDKVTDLRPGDDVFGWCKGAFAEYVAVPAADVIRKPASLSFEEAAGVPMAGMVALQALRDIGRVEAGQRVLIVGASGGIGTFAVQIASALGAEVSGVCSTANLDLVRSLGAVHVIDYTQDDYTRSGQCYDFILDMADNRSLAARRGVLAPAGTLVPNNGVGGRWIGSTGRILGARLLSLVVRQRLRPFLSLPRRDDLIALAALAEAGEVRPVVGRTYQLAETPGAVDHVGAGHARGKVVVTP